ncbi:hypothetical protein RQP46_001205 [Phenoliferia psychrophenolica]
MWLGPHLTLAAFAISTAAALTLNEAYAAGELGVAPTQSYHSSPATPPKINLWPTSPVEIVNATTDAPLYTFIGTRGGPEILQPAPMILDDAGELVWMGSGHGAVLNFERNQYLGNDILTFYVAAREEWFGGHWRILNSSFDLISTIEAKDTLISLDPHELHILGDLATVTYWEPVRMDLRPVGGPEEGWGFDCRVQSISLSTGKLQFQWNSAQYFFPEDSYNTLDQEPGHDGTAPDRAYDFFHLNSAEMDHLGNFIVSARGPSAIIYVDGKSGAVLWVLGGRRSSFAMGEGTTFWFQHHARIVTTGPDTAEVSLFDNGANQFEVKTSPSRGIVVGINTKSMEATLLREVVSPFARTSIAEGSTQLLPNGHLVVGWGVQPYYTEFDAQNKVVQSAQYGTDIGYMHSYRISKSPFKGEPRTLPSFARDQNSPTLLGYASWNGATQVANWRVLEADFVQNFTRNLSQVSLTRRVGFETTVPLTNATEFIAVAAFDAELVDTPIHTSSEPLPA